MRREIGGGILELAMGDITLEAVDAIVNAAKSALAGGGGVDGATHRRGGPKIMEECRRIGGCPPGNTVMTGGGLLPAKWVLHTVGPIWRGGGAGEAEVLASCYATALGLARDGGMRSISFPSISTGAYGYPVALAAEVALRTIKGFLEENTFPKLVRMVLFDQGALTAYGNCLVGMVPDEQ